MGNKISAVVPCYNEQEALPYFLQEIRKVAYEMAAEYGVEFEFLFVNDGSADGTLQILREAAQADPRVRYISFSRNFGSIINVGVARPKGRATPNIFRYY